MRKPVSFRLLLQTIDELDELAELIAIKSARIRSGRARLGCTRTAALEIAIARAIETERERKKAK